MRIAMYVDALSLWNGANGYANQINLGYRPKVDYRKLKATVQGTRELSVARAYVLDKGKVPMDEFATRLNSLGYEVTRLKVENWTAFRDQLEDDIDRDAEKVDTIVLVTQDVMAWARMAKELNQDGLRVEFWSFAPDCEQELALQNSATCRLDRAVFQ